MKHIVSPSEQLVAWAALNDIQMRGIEICSNIVASDGSSKGGGILATAARESEEVLLSIPGDLALSKETVFQCAKTDHQLRELVEAMHDFIQAPRKAIIVFLLYQLTISSPDLVAQSLGVRGPFSEYSCALPKQIPLPTFFSSDDRELLYGTALLDALNQKLASLEDEFDMLRKRTSSIAWCQKAWWDDVTGRLTLDDWFLADALYRSRALDLPHGIGDAMVPVLDMANHAADDRYNARFDMSEDGRVLLVVKEGRRIQENEEVTITYGCGGASEMIFSYGFLEENIQSAREMFLSLRIPDDDPLRMAKLHLGKEAPGFRIFLNPDGQINWESNFVWWLCINQEDGLDFAVAQTTGGVTELQAQWKGQALDPDKLETTLQRDQNWDLFRLRATVAIQERVERQGDKLGRSQANFEDAVNDIPTEKREMYETIRHLRDLELDLLSESYEALEKQKQELLTSRTVTEYLAAQTPTHDTEGEQEEDFS